MVLGQVPRDPRRLVAILVRLRGPRNRFLLALVFFELRVATLADNLEADRHAAAHETASCALAAPAFLGSLANAVALELGHDGQDREKEFASAVAGHRVG